MTINEKVNCLSKVLDHNFCKLKAIEECIEISEVLVKSMTKSLESQPTTDKIIEELADCILRLNIISDQLNINNEVISQINTKIDLLYKNHVLTENNSKELIIKNTK